MPTTNPTPKSSINIGDPVSPFLGYNSLDDYIFSETEKEQEKKKNTAVVNSENNTFFKNTRDVYKLTADQNILHTVNSSDKIPAEKKQKVNDLINSGFNDTNLQLTDSVFEESIKNDSSFNYKPFELSPDPVTNITNWTNTKISSDSYNVLPTEKKQELQKKAEANRLIALDAAYSKSMLDNFKTSDAYKSNPQAIDTFTPSRGYVKINGDMKIVDLKRLNQTISDTEKELQSINDQLKAKRTKEEGNRPSIPPSFPASVAINYQKQGEEVSAFASLKTKLDSLKDLKSKIVDDKGQLKPNIYSYDVSYGFGDNFWDSLIYNSSDLLFGGLASKNPGELVGKAKGVNALGFIGVGAGVAVDAITGKSIPDWLFGREGLIHEQKGRVDTEMINDAVSSGALIDNPDNITPNDENQLLKAQTYISEGKSVAENPNKLHGNNLPELYDNQSIWSKLAYNAGKGIPASFEYMQGFKITEKMSVPLKETVMKKVAPAINRVANSITGDIENVMTVAGKAGDNIDKLEKLTFTQNQLYKKNISEFTNSVNKGDLSFEEALSNLQKGASETKLKAQEKLFKVLHSGTDKLFTGLVNYQFAAAYNNLTNLTDQEAQIDQKYESLGGVAEEFAGGIIDYALRKIPPTLRFGITRNFINHTITETFQEYFGDQVRNYAETGKFSDASLLEYFATMMPMTLTSGFFKKTRAKTFVDKYSNETQKNGKVRFSVEDGIVKTYKDEFTEEEAKKEALRQYYNVEDYLNKKAFYEQLELQNATILAGRNKPSEIQSERDVPFEETDLTEIQKGLDIFNTEQDLTQQSIADEKTKYQAVDRNVKIALDQAGIINLPKVKDIDPNEIVKYKGNSGYVVQDNDTKEYVFVNKKTGEETIITGGGSTQSQKELDIEKTKEKPSIDDFVQWTINGSEQFLVPQKIIDIQQYEDGSEYAKFEGFNSFVPLSQLEKKESSKVGVKNPSNSKNLPPKSIQGKTFQESDSNTSPEGKKEPISKEEGFKNKSTTSSKITEQDLSDRYLQSVIGDENPNPEPTQISIDIVEEKTPNRTTVSESVQDKKIIDSVQQKVPDKEFALNKGDVILSRGKEFVVQFIDYKNKKVKVFEKNKPNIVRVVDIDQLNLKQKNSEKNIESVQSNNQTNDVLNIEAKKADIEKRRQEELNILNESAKAPHRGFPMARDLYDKSLNEINAKYDAELEALDKSKTQTSTQSDTETNKDVQINENKFESVYKEFENIRDKNDEISLDQYKQEFKDLVDNGHTEDLAKETIIQMMLCK